MSFLSTLKEYNQKAIQLSEMARCMTNDELRDKSIALSKEIAQKQNESKQIFNKEIGELHFIQEHIEAELRQRRFLHKERNC